MSENRIPKIIINFEFDSRFQNWTNEMKGIFKTMDQLNMYDCKCQCDLGSTKLVPIELRKMEHKHDHKTKTEEL